jgi:hypothetical protein
MEQIEKNIEDLVAYDTIKSLYSSFSQRAERREKELAYGVYNRIAKDEKIPKDANVSASIEYLTEGKARGMKEGIEEFKKKYPDYGKILEGLIEEKRDKKEIYLNFGIMGKELPNAAYLRIFRDLGITPEDAHKVFSTVEIFESIKKRKQTDSERSLLIDLDKKKDY